MATNIWNFGGLKMRWIKQISIVFITAIASSILTYQFSLTIADKPAKVTQADVINTSMLPTLQTECLHEQSTPAITSTSPIKRPTTTDIQEVNEAINTEVGSALETTAIIERDITREIYARIEQERRHTEAIRSFLASQPAGDYNKVLQRRYENEEVNYDWAIQKEDQIHQILNNSEALSYIAPLDISCRSKNCQLIFPSNDQKQASELFEHFLNATQNNTEVGSPALTASYFSDSNNGELTLYISEVGNSSLYERRQ